MNSGLLEQPSLVNMKALHGGDATPIIYSISNKTTATRPPNIIHSATYLFIINTHNILSSRFSSTLPFSAYFASLALLVVINGGNGGFSFTL